MISYANTDKMKSIAKDLSNAVDDLEKEFTSLYGRFQNVPEGTKEWVGDQAKFYFRRISSDKKQYDILVHELKRLSKEINAQADDADAQIRSNNRDD